jgi:transcriptional regulator with XRE-family HTH domain
MDDPVQRKELAAFLRSRREATDPVSMGLKTGQQRRTPGLRREELAQLAGVSVTWYTWLEQARDISVSRKVIDSLARVLKISGTERAHLYTLAGLQVATSRIRSTPVDPTLTELVNVLAPHPASVINPWWDLLVFNDAYSDLLGGIKDIPRAQQNLLRLSFTTIRAAKLIDNWEAVVSDLVGQLRTHVARYPGDPRGAEVVQELTAVSPEFTEMWKAQAVARFSSSTVSMHHPVCGALIFNHIKLATADNESQQLAVWLPANKETERAASALGRGKGASVVQEKLVDFALSVGVGLTPAERIRRRGCAGAPRPAHDGSKPSGLQDDLAADVTRLEQTVGIGRLVQRKDPFDIDLETPLLHQSDERV